MAEEPRRGAGLWGAFDRVVQARPDHPALITDQDTTSFVQLRDRALDISARLADADVGALDRVLILVENSTDSAAAILGCWHRGSVAAILDSMAPPTHLSHAIDTIAPKMVLVDAETSSTPDAVNALPLGEIEPRGARSPAPPVRRLATDPASIVFTSGSSGRPKGVTQSHGNLGRGCRTVAGYLGLTAEDRILCPVPWCFDYGFGQFLSTVVLGISQIASRRPNPFALADQLAEHRPTVLAGTPPLYFPALMGLRGAAEEHRAAIRLLTNTGGTVHERVRSELRDCFPAAEFVLNYGLTETYRSCYLPPELIDSHGHTLGIPIPGVDIVVVDEAGVPVPTGTQGEIVHRGDLVCLGYWNDPAATERAVRPDPVTAHLHPAEGRALFTGDLGMIDDEGFVHFRGRNDRQLKSMGSRVSPDEIEQLLLGGTEASEVAVFGLDHDELGHEIWATLIPTQEGITEKEFLASAKVFARSALSPYMMPRKWQVLDVLPKTSNGKIDYAALKAGAERASPAATT